MRALTPRKSFFRTTPKASRTRDPASLTLKRKRKISFSRKAIIYYNPTFAFQYTIMSFVSTSIALVASSIFLYKAVNLARYWLAAKASGLPYTFTPALETEIWGYLLTPFLRKRYHDYLLKGKGWPEWCRFIIKDWGWEDKRRAHDQYGDVFLVVSPEGIICYSADSELNHEVFNRRNEFLKPRDKYKLLEPYGPNVATTEGKTYQFHVRITAAPFSEVSGVNSLVWNETLAQTRLIMSSWSRRTDQERELDCNELTLAVISRAGCGRGSRWHPPGSLISFYDAFHDTTNYLIAILLAPGWLLRAIGLGKAALAHSQLDQYLRTMIRDEEKNIHANVNHESKTARGNLLTSLLRVSASDTAVAEKVKANEDRKTAMTEDEIMGNLWIYLLAGYEASSNGILYGIITLAFYPEFQDKVIQEIDQVYAQAAREGRTELTYEDDFEKLEYTYGFMYETFRLFPGNAMITKMVHTPTEILVSPSKTSQNSAPSSHILPAGCRLYMNTAATHYHPHTWPSPYKLDPSRWFNDNKTTTTTPNKKIVASDRARQMRGTFLSFSDGSRACLGRKFAQAEYVAFLVAVLREYRIGLAAHRSREDVEKDLFWRCAGTVTLRPLDTLKLKFVARDK